MTPKARPQPAVKFAEVQIAPLEALHEGLRTPGMFAMTRTTECEPAAKDNSAMGSGSD